MAGYDAGWIALSQRANDAVSQTISGDTEREAALVVQAHRRRLDDELTAPRNRGGHGLDDTDFVARVERERLERATAEHDRIKTLRAQRAAKWNAIGQLRKRVQDWVLRGLPNDAVLEAAEDEPASKLLKKSETPREAVERIRGEIAVLAKKLAGVAAAPWPLATAMQQAEEVINKLAAVGQPYLDGAVRHGLPITFPTTRITSNLFNVEPRQGVPVGFAEAPDAMATLCWVLRDEFLAKVNTALKAVADDKNALSTGERETMTAQIGKERLALERRECTLIASADAAGETIDYRSETDPQALLSVRLRTRTPAEFPRGTSAGHAYDLVGG